MVTLLINIGLYAENVDYFAGPLQTTANLRTTAYVRPWVKNWVWFGKIQKNDLSADNLECPNTSHSLEELTSNGPEGGVAPWECAHEDDYIDTLELLHISDHLPKHKRPDNDEEFGYYLAGLVEGDGYIGNHRFEIAFHKNDTFLAYYIKKRIGYGSVLNLNGKNAVRYVLRHSEGLKRVIYLTNGKFVNNAKIKQLLNNNYDSKFNITILPPTTFDITTNYWLSGFADADGSFVIHLPKSKTHKTGYGIRLEFKIKQKNNKQLNLILKYIGGNCYYLNNDDIYYYNSTSFKVAKSLIEYFDKFQLNSSKYVRYLKWRKVYRMVQNKEHLTDKGLENIRKIQGILRD